jgi:hypothetical protein
VLWNTNLFVIEYEYTDKIEILIFDLGYLSYDIDNDCRGIKLADTKR